MWDVFIVVDVEFGLVEWWSDFVFDDFDVGLWIYDFVIVFECCDVMDVDVYWGVEFESVVVCCCFGVVEYDVDFFVNLVDEDDVGVGFGDKGC